MAGTQHVFDYLDQPGQSAPVEVVFGDEPFLRQLALVRLRAAASGDDDTPCAEFDGTNVEWRDVYDELCTVSLFNPSGLRVAVVRDADNFVQQSRARLEQYVESPETRSVLILEVSKWAANTRLYRLVDKLGMQVECRAPQMSRGKQKSIDHQRVLTWIIQWAKHRHEIQLAKNAATLLLDLVGVEFGLLDQEIAKLALHTDLHGKVSEQLVRDVVGGWRSKTAWELIDAAVSGNGAEALRQLDRLLQSGEHPQALFGPLSWSLRRFAAATRIYQQSERQGKRVGLPEALEQAGFLKWPAGALQKAEQQLKQLGRERASQLYQWLLDTDLALKGSHSSPEMARLALEHLIVRMDRQLGAPAPRAAARGK
jgi:DNA polymerase-3 subunit delta